MYGSHTYTSVIRASVMPTRLQINMQVVAGALPQGPSHHKCKSRKNIAHSRSKSCRGIFHASIVQVLVNRWPAQYYYS